MKFAIPVSGKKISPNFWHSRQFAFFNVDDEKKITHKEIVSSPEHQPGLFPVWLLEQSVTLIISGRVGLRAQNILQQRGIGLVVGAIENDPEQAVLSHLIGNLTTGEGSCDHGHGKCTY